MLENKGAFHLKIRVYVHHVTQLIYSINGF